jgi:hypothetical protein
VIHLRDALAANIPVITSMMNAYSSDGLTVPGLVQALSQALARTPQDAADMRARSRLAWYLDRTEPPGVPGPGQTSWMNVVTVLAADELGLGDIQQELTSQAGRPVNIVVFESYDSVKLSGPALRVPFLYQVKNYFAKQGQVAAQDETAVETEQSEEEELAAEHQAGMRPWAS